MVPPSIHKQSGDKQEESENAHRYEICWNSGSFSFLDASVCRVVFARHIASDAFRVLTTRQQLHVLIPCQCHYLVTRRHHRWVLDRACKAPRLGCLSWTRQLHVPVHWSALSLSIHITHPSGWYNAEYLWAACNPVQLTPRGPDG